MSSPAEATHRPVGPVPSTTTEAVILHAMALSKSYPALGSGSGQVNLFRELELSLHVAESVAIIGQSGAGKSSLLHLLAGLDQPTSGQVWLSAVNVTHLSPAEAAKLRNREIGFVWQFHYLLPEFTAVENVALPLLARGIHRTPALTEARAWLGRVGLDGRANHRSGELSGGEQQRVAIARALITRPKVLLADEPTGDLDDLTAAQLFDLLQRLCREAGLATLIVTHNAELARRCDRTLLLRNGQLVAA